jgi:hypothetical protein
MAIGLLQIDGRPNKTARVGKPWIDEFRTCRIAGGRQYSPLIRPGTVWTIRSMTQAGSCV